MSDSVTNVDVEDVLSSIRRLVTDTNSDARPKGDPEGEGSAEAAPETAPETAANSQPDALLLTSDFRVQPVDAQVDEAPENQPAEAANLSNLREAISERHHADYYEDDEPEDVSPVIDFIRHERNVASETPAEPEAVANSAWSPEEAEASGQTDEAPTDLPDWIEAGNAEITEAEVIEADVDEPWEAEAEQVVIEAQEDAAEDEAAEDEAAEDEEAEGDIWDAQDAEQDAAAQGLQPDDGDADDTDMTEPDMGFAAAAAASVFAQEDQDDRAPEQSTDPASGLADFEESILDEEALRDLVADIVREELTGELGERITRNVRKLVRREIHRALLTREFE